MPSKGVSVLLSLVLVLGSPGIEGWRAFADSGLSGTQTDAKTGEVTQFRRAEQNAPPATARVAAVIDRLGDPSLTQRGVSQEEIDQAVSLLEHYQKYVDRGAGVQSREAGEELDKIAAELRDGRTDPKLAIAHLFDRLSPYARQVEQGATSVRVISQEGGRTESEVKNDIAGKTLFREVSEEIGFKSNRRTIRKPDPNTGEAVVDAIIIETQKGADVKQRVVYNRKVHRLFASLKKMYFDQCSLVRKINNGAENPPLTGTDCKLEKGFVDKDVTPESIKKMREIYDSKQAEFHQLKFTDKDGRQVELLDYLKELDRRRDNNTLEQLDYRDLEAAQRAAMKFYTKNQLDLMQKMVLIQLSSYFSQVTNTTPKQKKDGTEALDPTMKDMGELQETLTQIESGSLEGYGQLMTKVFKLTKLSHEDQKYINPEMMLAAGEAFAYVSYAVKAKGRAFDKNATNEEIDAAVEEGQQWIKLAQIQLQTFEVHSLAIELTRLKEGTLRGGIGLRDEDADMKREAQRLIDAAFDQYLPALSQATKDSKDTLLKQAVATFYLTGTNAGLGLFAAEALQDRVKILAAKANQMAALYMAREFDKVKNDPKYKGRSAMDKLAASAYEIFLKVDGHSEKIEKNRFALENLARQLLELAQFPSVQAITEKLGPLMEKFQGLIAEMGFDEIPDLEQVQKDAQKQAIKEGKTFAAIQSFTSNIRIFDMMNQLDLYLRNYASTEMVSTESSGFWSQLVSFKWLDKVTSAISGGNRDNIIEGVMGAISTEAWEKLGKNKDLRAEVMRLISQGNYKAAMLKIQGLDPEAAKNALAEYNADKDDDPFDELDFDALMAKGAQDTTSVMAMGVIGKQFSQLQNYILQYMAVAAGYDALATAVLTAGLAPIVKRLITITEDAIKFLDVARAVRVAKATEQLAFFQRLTNSVARIGLSVSKVGLRVVNSWASNIVKLTNYKGFATPWTLARSVGVGFLHVMKHTLVSTLTMSAASIGMQTFAHWWDPETSQYKDYKDATLQGFLGGVSFGAKSTLLIAMSPVPSSALGNSGFGRFMNFIGKTPGPATTLVEGSFKVVPQLAQTAFGRAVAAAQGGFLDAAKKYFIRSNVAIRTLVAVSVFGWGFIDGAVKYWLAAELPKNLAEIVHHYGSELIRAAFNIQDEAPKRGHATAHVERLTGAQTFGAGVAQVSWLLLPTNGMYSPDDMKQFSETDRGMRNIIRNKRFAEVEGRSSGDIVTYENPWYDRSLFDVLWRGEDKQGKLTLSEDILREINVFDGKSAAADEVLAMGLAVAEKQGGRKEIADLVDALNAAAFKDAEAVAEALNKAATAGGKTPETLYAHFDADFKLEEVAAKPKEPGKGGKGVAVELKVRPDGLLEIAGGGAPKAAEAVAKINEALPKAMERAQSRGHERFNGDVRKAAEARFTPERAEEAKLVIDALSPEANGGKTPEKAYAQFDADLKLEGVTTSPKAAGEPGTGITIELAVRPDGSLDIARDEQGNLSAVNGAASAELFGKAEEAVARINKTLAKASARPLKPGERFVSNASVSAYEALLRDRLVDNPDLVEKIISDQSRKDRAVVLEFDKKDSSGKTVKVSVKVSGEAYTKLEDMADRVNLNFGTRRGFFAVSLGLLKDIVTLDPSIRSIFGQKLELRIWKTFSRGRLSRYLTERPLDTADAALVAERARLVAKDIAARADASPEENIRLLREQVERLQADSYKKDADELQKILDILGKDVSAEQRVADVKDALNKLLDQTPGASRAALAGVHAALRAEASKEDVIGFARARVEKALETLAEPKLETQEKEDLLGVKAVLDGSGPAEEVRAAALAQIRKIFEKAVMDKAGPKDAPESIKSVKEALAGKLSADEMAELGRRRLDKVLREGREGVSRVDPEKLKELIKIFDPETAKKEKWSGAKVVEKALEETGRLLNETPGARGETLKRYLQTIDGEATADERAQFAKNRMDELIKSAEKDGGSYAGSLKNLRKALEADISLRLANERIAEVLKSYRKGPKDAAAKDRLEVEINLFVDTWQRGVFGQLFYARKEVKNEKGEVVDTVWSIDPKYDFRDAGGKQIASFRESQLKTIKQDLLNIAEGKIRIFNLLESSGGKTLLGFVLVGFMEAYARSRGKEGALYVTTNGDLVAQAHDNYRAMFKGKKPTFEVITYSDLMLRQAMSHHTGTPSPFETHEVFADELDQLGLETALSLGAFNGRLSFAGMDPVQLALQGIVDKIMTKESEGLYQRFKGGQELTPEEFKELLKTNKGLREEYAGLRERAIQEVNAALERVSSGKIIEDITDEYAKQLGMPKEMIVLEMQREHRKAFGGWFELGVIERRYGGVDRWVDKVMEGAYQAASHGDNLDRLYRRDPERDAILQFHNDQAHESLDTFYRTALELKERVPVTLDFDNQAIVTFRSLLEAARTSDAMIIGASGTLPNTLRPILRAEMNWLILEGGNDMSKIDRTPHFIFDRTSGESQLTAAIHGSKDKMTGALEHIKADPHNIVYFSVSSMSGKKALIAELEKNKIGMDKISILTEPGAAYLLKERNMFQVEADKNFEGLREGKVKVVILVGQSGLRGLEAPLSAYEGGQALMYVLDSHKLAEANLSQVMERIGGGRLGKNMTARHILLDDVQELKNNRRYMESMEAKIKEMGRVDEKGNLIRLDLKKWNEMQEEYRNIVSEATQDGIVTHDSIRQAIANHPDVAYKIKEQYKDFITYRRIYEAVGEKRIKAAATDRDEMKDLLAGVTEGVEGVDPEVIGPLVREMRRFNEQEAMQGALQAH